MSRSPMRSRELANRYYREGRVVEVQRIGDSVHATVRGRMDYGVDWFWDGGTCTSSCSCPMGNTYCKHTYALALYLLDHPADLGQTSGTSTPSAAPTDLAKVLATESQWQRRETVRKLLMRPPVKFEPYDMRMMDILDDIEREADPELRCWMLARRVATLTGGALPRELAAYSDRADLIERHAQRERQELAHDLMSWVISRKKPGVRSLRFVWRLIAGKTGVYLTAEGRLTSNRMQDEPRTYEQLRQLSSEAQRKPGTLSGDQQQLLLNYLEATMRFASHYHFAGNIVSPAVAIALLKSIDTENRQLTWASDIATEIAARGGITPEAPLRLAPQQLRILPCTIAKEDGARLELACVWPDDRQRPLSEVLYFPSESYTRSTGIVLADGYFFSVADEPPQHVRDRLLTLGGLDIPREQCADMLAPLAHHFGHVRAALADHTRWVTGRPVVALDLRDDDWLQIRLFLHSSDDLWLPHQPPAPTTIVLELTPSERWQRMTPPPSPSESENFAAIRSGAVVLPAADGTSESALPIAEDQVWIEAPEPQTVAAAESWLTAIGAEPGTKNGPAGTVPDAPDRHIGWWMKASARRMAAFAELWDTRPAGVQFFGTERVQRLLSGGLVLRPKLKVKSSGLDWFAVSADWESEGLSLSDADMAKLRTSTSRFVKLASGWVRRDAVDAHDGAATLLADLGIEVGGGEQRITLWQLAGAKRESIAALEQMGGDRDAIRALTRLRQKLRRFKGVPQVAVPAEITAELRPYQQRGLDFLAYTSSLGIGVVLADDMGLGKTVQALAWLQTLVSSKPKAGPCLVVCPTSVMHNWRREAAQFAPKLRVVALERGEQRHELRKEIGQYDLVITNYALLRRDLEQWKDIELRAVILDEAQNIKNPDAAVSRAAFALRATHRLALTGTPLENRPLDLWSILNFVNPGYLGSRTQFGVRFDRVDAPPHARTLLAAKLRPVLLRRLKREVATDLPERIEERRDCELTDGQRQLYLAELRRSRKLVDELSEDPGALRKNKITILAALTRLRQICCHPALAKGKASLGSGKFEALFELLEPLLAEGHKVLLFSQFVQCLSLIERDLTKRGIAHYMLTGQTLKRQAVVQAFQEDPNPGVFLISLKAGGTGLNLTAASYVVLFDPWWNPAVEAQAIDRTHRIGQDRTVIAYRMLTLGTIEEKIWELQQKKSAMVADVLGEDGFARALSRDDLSFLLQEV